MRRRTGFTLIELVVVTAVMGVATYYLLGSLTVSNEAYVVIDQVAESQQGMRAVAHQVERDLRHAGMMVPRGAAVCALDSTIGPDTLYVSDAEAIEPGTDLAPYDGARVQGAVTNVPSTGNITLSLDSLILEPSPPNRPAYDTDGNGTADSDFRVNGGVIVMDLEDPTRGAACGRVTNVTLGSPPTVSVAIQSQALGATGATTQLVAVPAHEYRIVNGDQLLRNSVLLTEGVEDLQLAYFMDLDEDNILDANEMFGAGSGANPNFSPQNRDIRQMREARVNLVVRTRNPDRDFGGQPQLTENRAGGAAPVDGFRRRVHTSTVRLRNMVSRVGS